MATLTTGNTALSQVERSRQLAAALQQMATSFEPITHPYQGLAKLAQAWIAGRMNRQSDEREREIIRQRGEMIANALGGTATETAIDPTRGGTTLPSGQGEVVPSVFNQVQTTRPMSLQEQIAALPPDLAGPAAVEHLLQRGKAVTPRDAVTFGKYDETTGMISDYVDAVPGTQTFNQLVTDPEMIRVDRPGPRELTTEVPFTPTERTNFQELQRATNSTFFMIDELLNITESGGLPGGIVTDVALGIDSLLSQFHVAYRLATGRDDRYLTDAVSFDNLGSRVDLTNARLSDGTVVDLRDAYNEFVKMGAEGKAAGIGLSYALARQEDPGGRLSEADVLWQMQRNRLTSGSVKQIQAALRLLARQTGDNYSFAVRNLPEQFHSEIDPQLQARANTAVGKGRSYSPPKSFIMGGKEYPPGSWIINTEDGYWYRIDRGGVPRKTERRVGQ
jgi:hypothetical protein